MATSPLSTWSGVKRLSDNAKAYMRYRRRRIDLLDGQLSLCFLGGPTCDFVPVIFGEQFLMIVYRGIAIDPGSPKMRPSLARHLQRLDQKVQAVFATHHHEEHVGNLDWLARKTTAQLCVGSETLAMLRTPTRLPWARRVVIGQPQPLLGQAQIIEKTVQVGSMRLEVIPTPGHCSDHISLYDPENKVLLAGDAYMGTYFATPNPDVDSQLWIETLQRLVTMDIEVMVEGHGHVYTMRQDIPDLPGLVVRKHPRDAFEQKLRFFQWVNQQIKSGQADGWSAKAIEATCFPWGQRWAWENFLNDQVVRLLSGGHFSRHELIRSFNRDNTSNEPLPEIFTVNLRS